MISKWQYKKLNFTYLKEKQIPEIVNILHDKKVEKYLWFAPITIEGFSAYASPIIEEVEKNIKENKYPLSAIFVVQENGKNIGSCGISQMPDGHNVALIGYQLKQSAWGRGNATACLEFLLHYAKKYLCFRKIYGDCCSSNVASVRVLEKCNFEFEGKIKEKYELNGELHDNSWFGLNMDEVSLINKELIEEM